VSWQVATAAVVVATTEAWAKATLDHLTAIEVVKPPLAEADWTV
jgi:hypothetical protein